MATLATCATTSGDFGGITRAGSGVCAKGGGLQSVWVASEGDINFANTSGTYDSNAGILNDIVMVGGKGFSEIQTDGGESQFGWEKQENGNYLNTLTLFFDGTSCARIKAIQDLNNVCPLVVFLQFSNCTKLVSFEASGATVKGSSTAVRVSGDTLTSGTVDGDGASQTLTLTWTSKTPPVCANLTDIPTV